MLVAGVLLEDGRGARGRAYTAGDGLVAMMWGGLWEVELVGSASRRMREDGAIRWTCK